MIAYFDTSAIIPLVLKEPASAVARQAWDHADKIVSVHLLYAEGRAALARGQRMGRLTASQLRRAVVDFENFWRQVERVAFADIVVRRAGDLAEELGLRAYDAVHLAAAESVADPDLVLVAGDRQLCRAARQLELLVSELSVS